MKYLFAFLFLFSAMMVHSQGTYTDSKKLVSKGIDLYEKGKYKEAVREFDKVHSSDSLYLVAQYEKALALNMLEKYSEVLAIADLLISKSDIASDQHLILKANVLDDLERYDEAQQIYIDVTTRQPYHQNAWYNLGLSYYKSKKYLEAEKAFIRSISLKPWHFRSNLLLGLTNAYLGRPVHAIVCLNIAAIMTAGDEISITALQELERYTDGEYDGEIETGKYTTPDSITTTKITDLEPLLNSRILRSKKMKMPTKNSYTLTKYNYVVFNELDPKAYGNNIYTSFYFPLLRSVMDRGYFDLYSYYIMAAVNSPEVVKYHASKKAKVSAFGSWMTNELKKYIAAANGLRPKNVLYSYNEGNLSNISTYRDSTLEILEGEYIELDGQGSISAWAMYKDNKPVDETRSYFGDGKLYFTLKHVDDDNSVYHVYDHSGPKVSEIAIKNGEKNGPYTEFFPDGKISGYYEYKEGDFTGVGYDLYFNGDTMTRYALMPDNKHYSVTVYYQGGQLKRKFSRLLDDHTDDGDYELYYPNGTLEEKGTYTRDVLTGMLVSFYITGDTSELNYYDDKGTPTGKWRYFGSCGKLNRTAEYLKGKESYIIRDYNTNGVVIMETKVTSDKFNSVIINDTTGREILKQEDLNKANASYKLVNVVSGKTTMEVGLKNGQRDGTITTYSYTGTRNGQGTYSVDKLKGTYKTFYPDGTVRKEFSYVDGELDGRFKEFYPDGLLKSEGEYMEGNMVGEWKYYHPDSSLNLVEYYNSQGLLNGERITYTANSKKCFVEFYEEGNYKGLLLYGENGDTLEYYKIVLGFADVKVNFTNGNIRKKLTYQNDELVDSMYMGYVDGTIRRLAMYKHGELEGARTDFSALGKPLMQNNYRHGIEDGEESFFNEDGKPRYKGYNRNDEGNGNFTYYFEDGKVGAVIPYVNGARHGNADYFSPDGQFMFRLIYFDDDLVAYTYKDKSNRMLDPIMIDKDSVHIVTYYSSGAKSSECDMVGGMRHGKRVFYFPNGKVMEEETYVYEDLYGLDIQYRADGTKYSEINYLNDEMHGTATYYYRDGKPSVITQYHFGLRHGTQTFYAPDGKIIKTIRYFGGSPLE